MKNFLFNRRNQVRLKSSELALVVFGLVSTWVFGLLYYSDDFKYKFYVNSDEDFMNRIDGHFNNSWQARENMTHWLDKSSNYRKAHPNLSNKYLFSPSQSARPKLCIAILTKPRNSGPNRDYVSQTLVSLLARVKLAYQDEIRITLFDADTTHKHEDPDLKTLNNFVQVETIKQQAANIRFSIHGYSHMPKVKEAVDYISVMQTLYTYSDCKYGLLFEDDVIAAPDWYGKLVRAIREIEAAVGNNWMCLKLFTGFRYYDWIIHAPTVINSILFVLIGSIVQFVLFQLIRAMTYDKFEHRRSFSKLITKNSNHQANCLFILNLVVFTVFLNSSSIKPLGTGVKSYSQGFNAVAILYPREQLKLFALHMTDSIQEYINGKTEEFMPKDIVMNMYRRARGLGIYIVEPSIVQHVGVHSSLRNLNKKPEHIRENQYRPFQSYSFMQSYEAHVRFDPVYWLAKKDEG